MVIVIQLPILVIFSSLVMVNLRMEEMISVEGLDPDPSYLNTTSNVCIFSLFQNAFRIFIFYPLYTDLPRYTWESPPSQHHSSFS